MDYVLMTVIDERDQTLSGPLPVASLPCLGEMVHGFGRIISIQNYPGRPERVVAKVATGPHRFYTVREIVLANATLILPICPN